VHTCSIAHAWFHAANNTHSHFSDTEWPQTTSCDQSRSWYIACQHVVPSNFSCFIKADVKQMIYIADLCNPKITTEPLYNTPLFTGPYAAANNTVLLAWRPSQGTKLYCLVNRGTLGENNLPRVVARIMPRSESNPRPLDHESNAITLHHLVLVERLTRVEDGWLVRVINGILSTQIVAISCLK